MAATALAVTCSINVWLFEVESKVKARIASRDENDWTVAAALLLDCPVWTEDKDFLGAGVASWTTATEELYLAEI